MQHAELQAHLGGYKQERHPFEAPSVWWLLRDSNPGPSEYEKTLAAYVLIISASYTSGSSSNTPFI
jgi:hypothetical protein